MKNNISQPILSIVVPCYYEEEALPSTSARLGKLLQDMIGAGEVAPESHICFVNDGSQDRTWPIILELKDKIGGSNMELDFSGGMSPAAPVQTGNNAALAHAALQELGYSPAEINAALKGVDPNATTEEMVRHALRAMVMKG